ncbi:hypothetical protein R1479_03424 [Ralstonia mannitolilytica]|uniref:DUF488 domain-containing protein n=1 Tax=Ralstonia mannitolilytica TaxID=105219 RepID=UPI0028F4F51E|nr:DUF488 domain-containing protein [Ralstonia mannitolilytica]CAJ0690470.1 hypothetical protein LMG18102_01288 [Ralstonia mannitolilytica]CAJ0889407.1 hypothetical protein R1479_03424 [Ralstonia mannitolilytica]
MALPFCTIGHSDRSLEAFIELLGGADISVVVDIRKIPKSRAHPQFNAEALAAALAQHGIGYEHVAALGGLRGKTAGVAADINGWWTNDSFHRYADYALTPAFRTGLDHLIDLGKSRRCAIMCSEAVWWRCHRRIVADYLLACGETVLHIMGPGRLEPARMSDGAIVQSDTTIAYPVAGAT